MNEHARTTITLAFAPEDIERLDAAVRNGGYATREEAVLNALDALGETVALDENQLRHLSRVYREGRQSGLADPISPENRLAEMKRILGRGQR